ncbi:MAG: FN3 associated domain-containing protein, partial [Bacteroidota bacterium]|nr:FN3 associated domain-containing protein [Bacteroidota bacterium]
FQLISNAVYYLLKSKSTVLPASAPTVSMAYKNKLTEVSLSTTTADAKIYYTLNGTVPTTSSLVYSDTLSITDSCTIKAIAVKQGFDNSSVTIATVLVKSMAATPSISVAAAETGKAVTITASEGATVYYTTNGGTPVVAKAVKYTVPFTLIRPCTVKAIAVQDGKLNSDIASEKITIDGYKERAKTLVWANFNDSPTVWIDTMTTQNVDLFGAKGYAYTDSLGHKTEKTLDFKNGFMAGTWGQRVTFQATAVATSGNYSPYTDGDTGASNRAISFLRTSASTDPTTGYLVTTTAYNGPFDVTVWMTGAKGNTTVEKLEVSVAKALTDTTWTVLDTLTSVSDKYIRKNIAYYDATAPVFVKIKSVSNLGTNSNMMVFDVKLMGEGQDSVVAVNKPVVKKTLVSTRYYTIAGVQVKAPVYGVTIVRNLYTDGTIETQKMILKQRN